MNECEQGEGKADSVPKENKLKEGRASEINKVRERSLKEVDNVQVRSEQLQSCCLEALPKGKPDPRQPVSP